MVFESSITITFTPASALASANPAPHVVRGRPERREPGRRIHFFPRRRRGLGAGVLLRHEGPAQKVCHAPNETPRA
jgi:hypothetical protein